MKIIIVIIIIIGFSVTGCKKFVEVDRPISQVTSELVFATDANAIAAMNGVYSQIMGSANHIFSGNITYYAGMYSDELYHYNAPSATEFMNSNLSLSSHGILQSIFWRNAYQVIYVSNNVIEGVKHSESLSADVTSRLEGEAKFMRAFSYFYLVNLFGGVPLVMETNYLNTMYLPRADEDAIYALIERDLKEAQFLLGSSYPGGEKIRPNKWAATALLARVYLYKGDWQKAEEQASRIITSGQFNLPSNLRQVFLKNSTEAILQFQPVNKNYNTWEAWNIVPTSTGTLPSYLLRNELIISMEAGDKRKADWDSIRTYTGSNIHLPYKYKVAKAGSPLTEYYMVLRLGEVFLIRAEARAEQGKVTEGKADLDKIRQRAGLTGTTASTKEDLLMAIEQERRVELFAEWGHRWFDLKRRGRADEVIGSIKPGWKATGKLWPIPQGEMNLNPNLLQNAGY